MPAPEHQQRQITGEQSNDATLIWNCRRMGRELRPCSAAVGPGSRDLGVARRPATAGHFFTYSTWKRRGMSVPPRYSSRHT